jgi:N-acetylmuramoyl-L-alanine amidase
MREVLPFLDIKGRFEQFHVLATASHGDPELQVFQDFGAKKHLDYAVRLAKDSERTEPTSRLGERILQAAKTAKQSPSKALAGLRIALDPGHMGGDPWDQRAGKFVKDRSGHKLSEGLMALQISLLLEQRFKALGAQVMLTHRSLAPVTRLPYESYDLRPFALKQLRQSTLLDWFQDTLSAGEPGSALYRAMESKAEFNKLFSEASRWKYFFLGTDLDERVAAIEAFSPDVTLIIHLDANEPEGDPNGVNEKGYNGTKVYVPGGFFPSEFASRDDRKYFGAHLLDQTTWNASLQLSRSVVGQIHSQLGVRFDPSNGGNSVQIEPGVFARNLSVQRRLVSTASSYVECLYYNDASEFAALSRADHSMMIDGKSYPYSERLRHLAQSIGDGVLQFVKNYQE